MPKINDHAYMKICAQIASCESISLASARRKVELVLAKRGKKGVYEHISAAQKLLDDVNKNGKSTSQLDDLLKALAEEENFMTED